MLSSPSAPSPFPTFGRFPLYVTFRELYCYSPCIPLPLDEHEGGFESAFLPIGCQWNEVEVRLAISCREKVNFLLNRQGLSLLDETQRSRLIILYLGEGTWTSTSLIALVASQSQVRLVLLMSSSREWYVPTEFFFVPH